MKVCEGMCVLVCENCESDEGLYCLSRGLAPSGWWVGLKNMTRLLSRYVSKITKMGISFPRLWLGNLFLFNE